MRKLYAVSARGIASSQWWRNGRSHIDESEIWLVYGLVESHLRLTKSPLAQRVLDNWEHLLDGVSLVSEILQAAPGVQVLATSRLRLGLPEEHLFHLVGVDFPEWESTADALSYGAVRLFLQGARRARPGGI